jgi:hypothetical protein
MHMIALLPSPVCFCAPFQMNIVKQTRLSDFYDNNAFVSIIESTWQRQKICVRLCTNIIDEKVWTLHMGLN